MTNSPNKIKAHTEETLLFATKYSLDKFEYVIYSRQVKGGASVGEKRYFTSINGFHVYLNCLWQQQQQQRNKF